MLWFIDGRVKKEQVLHCILAIALSIVVVGFLKRVFNTPRPFMVEEVFSLTLFKGSEGSFPSQHTTVAFAIAATVWLHNKSLGSVFIVSAILVGVGRVLSNVHYPVDILGGAIVGILVATLLEKTHLFKITPK